MPRPKNEETPGDFGLWQRHLGKLTDAPEVLAEFQRAGVEGPPRLTRDESEAAADIGHLTIDIRDPDFAGLRDQRYPEGVGVVFGVVAHVHSGGQLQFSGALPFGITHASTYDELLNRFGEPIERDVDIGEQFYVWRVEGLELTVFYAKNPDQVEDLLLFLPQPGF